MTEMEKKDYIRQAFRDYITNKRILENLNFPGLGGVDYSRPSVVSDKFQNSTENSCVRYVDRKEAVEKQVEIVKRTIEYYRIDDKRHAISGKAEYIINRFLRRLNYNRCSYLSHISDRTTRYWLSEIYFTAETIAEEYHLFP